MLKVEQVLEALDALAPPEMGLEWDRCHLGLQVGEMDMPVRIGNSYVSEAAAQFAKAVKETKNVKV